MVETKAECEEYVIQRTLGEGGFGVVKLALVAGTDKEMAGTNKEMAGTVKEVALKILKEDVSEKVEKEIEILKKLKHDNVIKFIKLLPGSRYKKKKGSEIVKNIIVMEFASQGDFFNIISAAYLERKQGLSEKTTRTFFHQMVEAVEYCHNKGVVHRDIKPENILLDADYNVKLADFGLAAILDSKKHFTTVGTVRYWAPEMFESPKKKFEFIPTDIFALGIMLFKMRTGVFPFSFAHYTDKYYKHLDYNRPDMYWKEIINNNLVEAGLLTEDFKVLVGGMLKRDPQQRYTIADIKASKWYNGEIAGNELADKKTIEEEFELLREKIAALYKKEERERIQRRKQKAKEQQMDTGGASTKATEEETKKEPNARVYVGPYRSINLESLDELLSANEIDLTTDVPRKIKIQPAKLNQSYAFAFNLDLETLFKSLVVVSEKLFLDSEISKTTYAINKGVFLCGEKIPETDNDELETVEVKINIYQVGKEGEYVVECMKKKGDYDAFCEFVYREFFPALMDLVL